MPAPFRLTPDQVNELATLLSKAVDKAQLKRFVYIATGEELYVRFIEERGPLFEQVFELLLRFEKDPITERFLRVVYREKPFQFELRAFIGANYPAIPRGEPYMPPSYSVQQAGTADPSLDRIGPRLEAVVRAGLKSVDLRTWLDRIEAVERQVCRIEAGGGPIGTGFLVGPDLVMTNWHVVDQARRDGVDASLACRFDYRALSNGTKDPGHAFQVTSVVDESPCSPSERTANPDRPPPPQPDELDYALLAIEPAGADRGHVRLVTPPPIDKGRPLIIVQHPQGEPMKFAVDTDAVIGPAGGGLRLRYRTNTEPGSSGSPCFSMDFDLVALHHLGEAGSVAAGYNQGIPIVLIRDRIVAGGHGGLLGV